MLGCTRPELYVQLSIKPPILFKFGSSLSSTTDWWAISMFINLLMIALEILCVYESWMQHGSNKSIF